MTEDDKAQQWVARPVQAWLIRAVAFLVPIAGSIAFVHYASEVVGVPTDSFLVFVGWWIGMSSSATVVLIAVDRVTRRLLPLAALFRLSLVFPDAAPSRFRTALRSDTVESLDERIRRARLLDDRSTPVESAERLLALARELDHHDRLTRGHSDRVRAFARLIGKEMHLSSHDLDLLNWAALLHDIGKLSIDRDILTKPGPPTADEWSTLRRHPELGMEIVAPLRQWLGEWSDAVGQHHERWDGKGYPNGLSHEQITLAGRIVAVADVFDVITSARSYKSPFDASVARQEIAKCAGTQFDPRVVRAFLNVSLGRLRLVMGPLSWLAHAPVIGRLPLTSTVGTVGASVASVAAAVTTGFVSPPAAESLAVNDAPGTSISQVRHTTREDEAVVVGVTSPPGRRIVSLRLLEAPAAGRAAVTAAHSLRYRPAPDFNGDVTLRYEACWPGDGCRSGVIVISVIPVNDPPVARDDVASTPVGVPTAVAVLANDSDTDGDPLAITSVRVPWGAGTARIAGGTLRYTPARGHSGRVKLSYTITDGGNGRATAVVLLRVGGKRARAAETGNVPASDPASTREPPSSGPTDAEPGNAEPRPAPDAASVPEGGTVTIDVLANDLDPDGDSLAIVSVGTPSLGATTRIGDRVRFAAPSDFAGDVSFPYTVSDPGGIRTTGRVTVTVLLVNAPPTFESGPDVTVLEDSGERRLVGWATGIGPGKVSDAGQAITFAVSSDDPSLFAVRPRVTSDGTLTFTPARDRYGSTAVTVVARDDGGTANGGKNTSRPRTFTITVAPVNDRPAFEQGPHQEVQEDAGPQLVDGWVRSFSTGPVNERDQTLTYTVSTARASLFTADGQPRISSAGALAYTPAPNANGSTTVTVRARDDGGTANGGEDTTPERTFTITVGAVNDPPTFAAGSDPSSQEDSPAQAIPGWATGIRPGPDDESAQTVSFLVSNDNPGLFARQPEVTPNGRLDYTPAPDRSGSARVSVVAKDDGGTANGGDDTSATQVFTITVGAINDVPVAQDDAAVTDEDDPGGITFGVLGNDTDADTGDVLAVASSDASGIGGGTLTDNGGGSFTYVPQPSFSGTESFTYVVTDGNGGTDTATVTITVRPQPDAPSTAADAYITPQDTALAVAAPGVLGNDGDEDGDSLTVRTTPVSAPANGTLVLSSDGSFTYVPNTGFVGTDAFVYRVDDGTGRSDDGVVTITVSASITSSVLYLSGSGPSANVWGMTTTPPPSSAQVPDYDADGKAGLTIENGNGDENTTNPLQWQEWVYTLPAAFSLNGPVVLELWGALDSFVVQRAGHPHVYLYDCASGGTGCTKIAENDVHINPWSLLPGWVSKQITIGSVTRTIAAGREIRVRLLVRHRHLWVAMTAAYPSALRVTLG